MNTLSSITDRTSQLAAILIAEANIAAELLSLLEEEPLILANHDPQAILTLSQRKQNLATQLAERENERCCAVEEMGLPINLSPLEKALQELGAEATGAACHNLKQIATLCAEYNRSAGILIESRLRHVLRALEIVTGRVSESEFPELTYGQRNLGQRGVGRSWAKV